MLLLWLRLDDQEMGTERTAAAVAVVVALPDVAAIVLLPLRVHLLPGERTVVDSAAAAAAVVVVVVVAVRLPLFLVAPAPAPVLYS